MKNHIVILALPLMFGYSSNQNNANTAVSG